MVIQDKALIKFFKTRGFTGSTLSRDIAGRTSKPLSGQLQRAFRAGKFPKNRKLFNRALSFQQAVKRREKKQKKVIRRVKKEPITARKVKKLKEKEEKVEIVDEEEIVEILKDKEFEEFDKGTELNPQQRGGLYRHAKLFSWSSICTINEVSQFHDYVVLIPKPKTSKELLEIMTDNHFTVWIEPDPEYHELEEILEIGFFVFNEKFTKKIVFNLADNKWYLRSVKPVKKRTKTTKRIKL